MFNSERYAARWLWDRAKEHDEWPQTNPGDDEGTSVRAGGDVLIGMGHVNWANGYADDDATERAGYQAQATAGIKAFRWAQSVAEVHAALGNPQADELGAVQILNS